MNHKKIDSFVIFSREQVIQLVDYKSEATASGVQAKPWLAEDRRFL